MNLSLAGVSLVEILQNEWVGIIASTIVLISFLTTDQIKTRIINSAGCVVFVIYGLMLPAYSTAFMNIAMLAVHIVFLTKHFIKRHKEKHAEAKEK